MSETDRIKHLSSATLIRDNKLGIRFLSNHQAPHRDFQRMAVKALSGLKVKQPNLVALLMVGLDASLVHGNIE